MKRNFAIISMISLLFASGIIHAEQTPLVDGKARMELPATGSIAFSFQHNSGNIIIKGHEANEIRVEATEGTIEGHSGYLSWDESKQVVRLILGIRTGRNDVQIWLPRDCEIKLQAIGSDISISGTGGNVVLKLVNGDIKIDNASGAILIESVNGKTQVWPSVAASEEPISIMSQNGDIHLVVPGHFKGLAKVATINGKVFCEVPGSGSEGDQADNRLKLNLGPMTRQSIPINSGSRPLILNTVNGDIHIRIQ